MRVERPVTAGAVIRPPQANVRVQSSAVVRHRESSDSDGSTASSSPVPEAFLERRNAAGTVRQPSDRCIEPDNNTTLPLAMGTFASSALATRVASMGR